MADLQRQTQPARAAFIPGCHESVVAQCSLPRRRIDPIRKQRARNLVTRPRLIERHIGMDSQRERLVFAVDLTGRWWTK